MRLPLAPAAQERLFQIIDALDALGCRCVLVGGLVPPLLLEALDPEGFAEASDPRATRDCDLAVRIAMEGESELDRTHAQLSALGMERRASENQFRWRDPVGLHLDLVPVPAGIEAGDPRAVSLARAFVQRDTELFFRGYELALSDRVEVHLEDASRTLQIAGLVSLLAMKLQAWTDRRIERRRDARDVAWLLRYLSPGLAAEHLARGHALRPDLVVEVLTRLRASFSDADHDGVSDYIREAYSNIAEAYCEKHRRAVVAAVAEVLRQVARGLPELELAR